MPERRGRCSACHADKPLRLDGTVAMHGAGECPHGGDSATCPPCRTVAAPRSVKPKASHGGGFPARFDGQCRGCNLPIFEGDIIVTWSDGRPATHEGCS